jgi:hypothetical protein
MANEHMTKCFDILAIKEMQIKTTQRFHLTPVKMAIKRKQTTTNPSKDVRGKRLLCIVFKHINS